MFILLLTVFASCNQTNNDSYGRDMADSRSMMGSPRSRHGMRHDMMGWR